MEKVYAGGKYKGRRWESQRQCKLGAAIVVVYHG